MEDQFKISSDDFEKRGSSFPFGITEQLWRREIDTFRSFLQSKSITFLMSLNW
jgi:hypothetical protein